MDSNLPYSSESAKDLDGGLSTERLFEVPYRPARASLCKGWDNWETDLIRLENLCYSSENQRRCWGCQILSKAIRTLKLRTVKVRNYAVLVQKPRNARFLSLLLSLEIGRIQDSNLVVLRISGVEGR